jgi:predicted glutamine amidotransferase
MSGSTDSEVMFFLALSLGLEHGPVNAVERMAGLVESIGKSHGVEFPLQMTVATTDGDQLWCFRYSSERDSRSLFFSNDMTALRAIHPDNEVLSLLSEETRLVVSEPLGDLRGAWVPVPEGSFGVIQKGADDLGSFGPIAP